MTKNLRASKLGVTRQAVVVAAALLLATTACGPEQTSGSNGTSAPDGTADTDISGTTESTGNHNVDNDVAEVLYSWDENHEYAPRIHFQDPPEVFTDEDEVRTWLRASTSAFFDPDFDDIDEMFSAAAEDHFLVAAGHRRCSELAGAYVEEFSGEFIVRVDYTEEVEEDACGDVAPGTYLWQIPRDETGGEDPAAVVTSTAAGSEMPDTVSAGRYVWSGSLDWVGLAESDVTDLLPDIFERLYTTQENLDELVQVMTQLELDADESLEPLEGVDMATSSLIVSSFDTCAGAWVEIDVTPGADPAKVLVTVMSPSIPCEAPDHRVVVWEVPDLIIGEDPQIEREHINLVPE